MYVSRYLKVDPALKFKKLKLWKIQHHRKVSQCYVLCTADRNLFEIIQAENLSDKDKDRYVVAVSSDKGWLIERVVELVDQLYNQKSIDYGMLKT